MNSFKARFSMEFFKKIISQEINLEKEYENVNILLQKQVCTEEFTPRIIDIISIVNKHFLKIDSYIRDGYSSINKFLYDHFSARWNSRNYYGEKNYSDYFEVIYTFLEIIFEFNKQNNKQIGCNYDNSDIEYNAVRDTLIAIFNNLNRIADKLDCEFKCIYNNGHIFYQLVRKKLAADLASINIAKSGCRDYQNYQNDIFKYLSVKNQGNLNEKNRILANLNKYVEFCKKDIGAFNSIIKDITKITNNFGVHHYEGDTVKIDFKKIPENELEKLYDAVFETILLAIIATNYSKNNYKSQLDEAIEKYREK